MLHQQAHTLDHSPTATPMTVPALLVGGGGVKMTKFVVVAEIVTETGVIVDVKDNAVEQCSLQTLQRRHHSRKVFDGGNGEITVFGVCTGGDGVTTGGIGVTDGDGIGVGSTCRQITRGNDQDTLRAVAVGQHLTGSG
jgi:hypothetical protein